MNQKSYSTIYYIFRDGARRFLNDTINALHEEQITEWEKKINVLGQTIVNKINETNQDTEIVYEGATWIKYPKKYRNDIFFSISPFKKGFRGKAVLSLRQQHNGVPDDNIEVILQTTDKYLSIIAEDAIREFNMREHGAFVIKHYDGSRMTAIKYGRV